MPPVSPAPLRLAAPVSALLALACTPGPADPVPQDIPAASAAPLEPAAAPADVARGRALLDKFECARCHDGAGLTTPPRDRHCVNCHQDVLAGTFPADPAVLTEWQHHITHLVELPALHGLDRFRRAHLAAWLAAPHDLRPRLNSTMPRLRLADGDAAALAAVLVPAAESAAPALPADPQRGRLLLARNGCMTCHVFTGVPAIEVNEIPVVLADAVITRAIAQAPDLRHTRDRLRPAGLHAWLLDPPAVKPGTLMPKLPLSAEDAAHIAAYLTTAALAPLPPPVLPTRLPLLDRRVTWAEVDAKIFKKTCWHCHSDPDFARGDGGPGNSGGFGFPGRKLDLASYAGISSGSLGPDNQRRSVFKPIPFAGAEVPRIVAHLLARHHEVALAPDPDLRGMPLGLTPVALEDIQLLETWIAQGRPE